MQLLIGVIHVADTLHAACEKRPYKKEKKFNEVFEKEIKPKKRQRYHPHAIKIINENEKLKRELVKFFRKK